MLGMLLLLMYGVEKSIHVLYKEECGGLDLFMDLLILFTT